MEQSFSEDDLRAYVEGTASDGLALAIRSKAESDPTFRAEIAVLEGMRRLFTHADAADAPDELGWRRLEKSIQADQAAAPVAVPVTASKPAANQNFWRVAAAACGLIVVMQGAYIVTGGLSSEPARYETASNPADEHVLGLAFETDARMEDITALLREYEGVVIGGPGALSLYRVGFDTAEAMERAIDALKASSVVRMVAKE